jgi:hypothetical protein
VQGDTSPEPDETLRVQLSGATGAEIDDGLAIGRIVNDDPPITVIEDPRRYPRMHARFSAPAADAAATSAPPLVRYPSWILRLRDGSKAR